MTCSKWEERDSRVFCHLNKQEHPELGFYTFPKDKKRYGLNITSDFKYPTPRKSLHNVYDRFNKEYEDADPESNITDGEESFNQDHGEGNIRDYNIIDDGERVASAFRSASSVCSGIFNHG